MKYTKKPQSKKEINLLIYVFIFIGMLGIGAKTFEYFNIKELSTTTIDIFDHPLKVSNAALTIKVDIYKIHRDMKDIVLSSPKEENRELIKEINEHEQRVYKNLNIIEQNILGADGLIIQSQTKLLFEAWKPIRDEVIRLVRSNQTKKAVEITQGKGAKHVLKLESSAFQLYNYAHNKAIIFKNKSISSFKKIELITILAGILLLIIFIVIGYYITQRLSKYMYRNEHLKNVLSVIRDVHQLIVREKNKQKLIQEICSILTLKHVYGNAYIILLDSDNKIDYITNTDRSKNATLWKEKIESGWIPRCIEEISQTNQILFTTSDTKQSCETCPLTDLYNTKSACTIALKHNEITYGYLTLSVDKKYITNQDELTLLNDIASDIAYALYNIKIEEKLTVQEERYRFAIEGANDGIWDWDLVNNKLYYSARWKEMLGYSDTELENSFETWEKHLNPADKEQTLLDIKASQESLTGLYSNIHRLKHKNGNWVWIQARGKSIFNENGEAVRMIGSHSDITDRKIAEQSLKEVVQSLEQKKEELETIIQEAPNPIMIHNEDGKVIQVNKVWEELTGYSYNEIDTIEKWTKKAYGKEMPTIKKYVDNIYELNRAVNEGEYSISTNNAGTIIWQFSTAPIGIIDSKRTVISSAMDITDLKKKDEMLIAQSRSAAMGEMIGMIAHQWRQPISVITMIANNMLLDILLDNINPVQAKEYAEDVIKQTEHLSNTIDDFRNFFKPDKEVCIVKIEDILNETYSIIKDSLSSNSIELKTSYTCVCESECKFEIEAYPRELMQVFVNIINNAKDSLVANNNKKASIEVKVYEDDNYVITDICDNGIGIDPKNISKIFDPYFTTKDEKTGTGLGLYMSKMIIEKHLHGKIEVVNEATGVCFKVKLLKFNGESKIIV